MRPFIIPIFLPQLACPYRCIYCHQPTITGQPSRLPEQSYLDNVVQKGLASKKRKPGQATELAFYGGTFTNLPLSLQEKFLSWAGAYRGPGKVDSIRLSTRPDTLTESRVAGLLAGGVRTIELGIQTLNDEVLALINRGHTRKQAIESVTLLKKYPVRTGVQLMVGLPGDTDETFLQTVEDIRALKPDMVRLYPTLIFADTLLARWWAEGRYTPLSLEEALSLCRRALVRLESSGIPVIRLGLQDHSGMNRENGLLAGPFHPAFGSLARSHGNSKKEAVPEPVQ
jgi:histone acetyltransferase (RNA polymerase elongator complex component)